MNAPLKPNALRKLMARPRRVLAAVLVALLPAACASGNDEIAADAEAMQYDWMTGDTLMMGPPATVGNSLVGNYLAGRHAQVRRDIPAAAEFLGTALEMAPEIPDLLRRTFVLMVVEGRMEEATALARRVVKTKEDDLFANLTLITDDIHAGRFADAGTRAAGMPDKGINAFLMPLLRAWALAGDGGDVDAALDALQPLSKNDGAKALRDLHAALINEMAGRTAAAEKGFVNAIEDQGGLSLRLAELLGAHYERAGKPKVASALYRKYLDAQPGSHLLDPALARIKAGIRPINDVDSAADGAAEGLFGLASSLRQQNAHETALMFGRLALYLRPDFPVMQSLVAGLLESNNRLEKANNIYASIDPNNPLAWSARMSIAFNLDKLGRTDEAVRQLEAMSDEDPADAEPLINLGDILRGKERFEEAIEAYTKAMERIGELAPQHWSLFYSRGIALEQSQQWPRAEADFLKALEFEPDQPYVLNYLGYSWIDKGLNLERGKEMIKKAVELRPTDGFIVDSLGWVLYRLGEYREAVSEMERAVELLPEDPIINDHLGDVYWRVGRRYEARFQWYRALSLEPKPEDRPRIEEKIKRGLAEEAKAGTDG